MKTSIIAVSVISSILAVPALAGDAPSIGGGANISANIGKAGVVNAGAGASGFKGTLKQSVASVLDGTVNGGLQLNVNVSEAGIANIGAGASGATITACQAIGTIGSNCDS